MSTFAGRCLTLSSAALQFCNQIFETVVTEARTAGHSGCEDHFTHFARWIPYRGSESRPAALVVESRGHDRDAVGKLFENLCEHEPAWWRDLPILAMEGGLSFR